MFSVLLDIKYIRPMKLGLSESTMRPSVTSPFKDVKSSLSVKLMAETCRVAKTRERCLTKGGICVSDSDLDPTKYLSCLLYTSDAADE